MVLSQSDASLGRGAQRVKRKDCTSVSIPWLQKHREIVGVSNNAEKMSLGGVERLCFEIRKDGNNKKKDFSTEK